MVKKEDGSGIDYAVYIIAIFVVSIMIYFLIYQQKAVVMKETLKNGLQMCENHVLTFAQPEDGVNSDILDIRERNRAHIIVDYDNNAGLATIKELEQIKMIATEFERKIKEHFCLDGNNVPQNNTLAELGAGELTISSFVIYEAVYNDRREIENYIQYDVHIGNGAVTCAPKKIVPAETTIGGQPLRGSLIYATLNYAIDTPFTIFMDTTNKPDKFIIDVESCVDIVLHKNY